MFVIRLIGQPLAEHIDALQTKNDILTPNILNLSLLLKSRDPGIYISSYFTLIILEEVNAPCDEWLVAIVKRGVSEDRIDLFLHMFIDLNLS